MQPHCWNGTATNDFVASTIGTVMKLFLVCCYSTLLTVTNTLLRALNAAADTSAIAIMERFFNVICEVINFLRSCSDIIIHRYLGLLFNVCLCISWVSSKQLVMDFLSLNLVRVLFDIYIRTYTLLYSFLIFC